MAFAVLLYALLSWIGIGGYSWPVRILYDLTNPLLSRVRRVIPPLGILDLSPIIVIIALYLIPSLFRWLVLLFI
jgi:YggT family protein